MPSRLPDRFAGEFETFFRAEHPRLVAICLALTGDREMARDVAAEALYRAHQSWMSLDQPSAWVRRVATNLAIDGARRQQRENRALQRVAMSAPIGRMAADPVDDEFWVAVRALPERQQAAVVLHYVEDRSVAEVAGILNIAQGTVKATLFKARHTLTTTMTNNREVLS